MSVNVHYFRRCIEALDNAYEHLQKQDSDDIAHDIFRAACVKEFELVLGQSGKLLKMFLRSWFVNHQQVEELVFRDVFRSAVKHSLITVDACERWFNYRDCRNDTAHEYGLKFAEAVIELLPDFIADAKELASVIEGVKNE